MIKLLLKITVMLLVSIAACGQARDHYEKLVTQATQYYEEEQYNLAAQLYREALALNISDPAVDYNLAECYRKTFDYAEAEVYYLKVLYTGQSHFPLSLFYHGLMLKLNGNTTEAMKQFDRFIAFHEHNVALLHFVEQAIVEKAGCEMAQMEMELPIAVKAELLESPVNSSYNDFAPALRDAGTLVVTSSRIQSNRDLIDERNGEAFSDNYLFQRGPEGWIDRTRKEFSFANTLYHDGSGSFTKKGDRYFFTICESQCRIFETHTENGKWTRPAPLDEMINHPASDAKQPAISPGGDTLFFASNRPGGFGQFDIWFSIRQSESQWSRPINAGQIINTKANDIAPSLTALPSVLFFSSQGHAGYGGYDLFVAKRKSGGDTVLYNLNFPFNSVKDDCFITFNEQEVYWSSNRSGGKGGFDIYAGKKVSALGLVSKLSLKNRNDSRSVTLTSRTARSENLALLASRNEETIDYNNLTYERKELVTRMVQNRLNNRANDPADFTGLTADEFEMLNEISRLRFQTLLLKQKYASTLLGEVDRPSGPQGPLSITGQLINAQSGAPISLVRIFLTNEYGDILKITSTNDEGTFRFTDVAAGARLFLRLESHAGSEVNAFVRDIRMMTSDKKNSLYVENVYFDFDHYVIRPEAAQVLGELAQYLKANAGVQVEIYAFADDRGSSAYNFELTQKRGEAVVSYLISRGVDATSLAIIPKGKQGMRRGVTEIQRQYNRRAEFYINGARQTFTPSVKTYILKKGADWSLIAKLTGFSKEQLKNLNGANADIIKAYQPVRLPASVQTISEELFFVGI